MHTLKLLTWNLGFGAMGAQADMSFEGGKKFIPSSKSDVRSNIKGIQETLAETSADIYFLQELSSGSLMNKWQNLRKPVEHVLQGCKYSSVSNFALPLFFDILRNEHGMGTYVNYPFTITRKEIRPFRDGERYYKIIPRWDYALTTFVETNGTRLALVNTHLSSFDMHGIIRISQFSELMEYIQKLECEGYSVIVGADWNMSIGRGYFLDQDKESYKDYVCYFPHQLLPKGWSAHFPDNAPTMRYANKPYKKGEAATATIDGFICSPNIQVEYVRTIDKGFTYSDHNPVEMFLTY